MPIYDYQGVQYDIDTTDPEVARAKIRAHLGPEKGAGDYARDFGKATASLADTALNAITGTLDTAAYPVARAFGRTPEQATAETTSPKDVIGRAFGITQDPAYQQEASRRLMGGIGQGIEQYAVKPIAATTGLPESDVASMTNTAMMGVAPAVNRGVRATAGAVGEGAGMAAQAAKTAGQGAVDLGRGTLRGMAYPAGTAENTALLPIKPTYVPHEQVRQFMAGERPATSLTEAPTGELINQTPGGRWAYGMAPKNAAGERLVPAQGRLMEGIGENIGSGIRTNPLQGLLDIGGLVTTGTPVGSMIRAVPAAATGILNKATQFEPGFVPARAAALAQEGRAGLQAAQPQTPLLPAPGPVRPGATPTVYVAPSGEATTNLAGTQTNYTPAPARSSTFGQERSGAFGQVSKTPAELSREAAAAKINTPKTPEQQAILDQIRARATQAEADKAQRVAALQARAQAAGGYTPPRAEAPVVPEAPATPAPAPTNTLEALRSRLTPQTPEQAAAVEAYNALTPAEKAAQTRAQNKAPPGVSNMIVPESGPVVHESKAAFDKANLFNTVAGRAATGSYREGNKIITVYPYQGEWPWPPGRPAPTTTQAVDVVTGERVPVGKTWNPAIGDSEPLSSKVRKKLNKNK